MAKTSKNGFCFLLIACSLLINTTYADPIQSWWQRYEGLGGGQLFDIYATTDGCFVACGASHQDEGISNWWLLKTTKQGAVSWQRYYTSQQRVIRRAYSLIETDDNGFAVVGCGMVRACPFIMRTDENGDTLWTTTLGPANSSGALYAVIELKGGGFAVAGELFLESQQYGLLARIEDNGQVLWERMYGDENRRDRFIALREVADEGLVAGGAASINLNNEGLHFWLVKVDFEGNIIWDRLLPQDEEGRVENPSGMTSCSGGFAMCGIAAQDGQADWLLKRIDNQGNQVFSRSFQIRERDDRVTCSGIARLPDNGFMLVGTAAYSAGPGVILRINSDGEETWRRSDVFDDWNPVYRGVITRESGEVFICGNVPNPENQGRDVVGLICKFSGDNVPHIVDWSPEDIRVKILPGDSTLFWVRVEDVDDTLFNYAWFLNRGELEGDSSSQIVAIEDIGQDTMRVLVNDGQMETDLTWYLTITDLFISSFSPDSLSLALRRGTSQTFSLDTVRAVEGDPVQYQWTVTNLDNFEREDAGSETSAMVEFLRSGNYQMEGLAYRGESSDNVIWTIAVRSAILDFWPRELSLSVPPDSSSEFGVIPFNPDSDSLSYRWEVDGDSVGSDSIISLPFAWRGFPNPPYQVSAIVTDGAEGDTIRWEVTVQDPNTTPPTPPSIEGGESPATFGIVSVSPNPFNSTTTIRYSTGLVRLEAQPTRLTVHDLTGREVARLVDERAQQSPPSRGGSYAVTFNGRDLPAGIYLVRLQAGERQKVAKIVLVR